MGTFGAQGSCKQSVWFVRVDLLDTLISHLSDFCNGVVPLTHRASNMYVISYGLQDIVAG